MAASSLPGRPSFSLLQAEAVAAQKFNFVGVAQELPSDRDQNFVLTRSGGSAKSEADSRVVLKISNANEDPAFLECQTEIMHRLSRAGLPVPSVRGQSSIQQGEATYAVRLVSWLEGTPIGLANPISSDMERAVGQLLGHMDQCLVGYEHAGIPTGFDWDLARAEHTISERLHLLPDEKRPIVERVLSAYRKEIAPVWGRLPQAVIHSDANDYNMLVGPPSLGQRAITGILDFGDVVRSARVGNPVVAAAYLALHRQDPVEAMCHVAAGYHAVFPLTEHEADVFFTLVCTRLAISVCMSAAQRAAEPENEYLSISEKDAWSSLEQMDGLYPRLSTYRIRDAVGLEPVPGSTAVSTWIDNHSDSFFTVVRPETSDGAGTPGSDGKNDADGKNGADGKKGGEHVAAAEPVLLDFSVGSLDFDPTSLTVPGHADRLIWDRVGPAVGIGRWNEPRLAYTGPQYDTAAGERRTIHVGIDLFRPAGTPVYAPLDGIVHSSCVHHEDFDYGGCIVLEHRPAQGMVFWTLYGHLDHASALAAQPGQEIKAGTPFAELGRFRENGGWVAHLHFQVITDLLGLVGTFPGVAAAGVRRVWNSLSPNPTRILGLPAWAGAPNHPTIEELTERRSRHLGASLSLSYSNPLHMVRGWQQYLYDADGHAYLDAVNNVPHVGHSSLPVVEALHLQMRALTTNTRYLHQNILTYAERLSALLPDGLDVCFFVNSGSEANDLALRLARAYTGNTDIIVLDGAYHGNLTSLIDISPYKFDGDGGNGKPQGTHVVRMPDGYRGDHKGNTEATAKAYAKDIEEVVSAFPDRVAAFIAESVPGCGGQIVPPPTYLARAAAAVRKGGGVFIADEVQVGMGRAGSVFWGFELDKSGSENGVQDQAVRDTPGLETPRFETPGLETPDSIASEMVVPDIVVLGKPIGNGHPLGAVVTTRAIADAFNNGMEYFNTFGGNPASCAVGLAVLDEIQNRQLQENALVVGNHLKEGLASLAPHHPIIGDVRGVGLFLGVELVRNQTDLEPADEEATYICNRLRDNGILISTDGPLHNVLKIKPPMVFTKDNADQLVRTLDLILGEDFVKARLRN